MRTQLAKKTLSSRASISKPRKQRCRGVGLRHVLWGHASWEDSAERLQRLTAREALVCLGWSWGLGMFWLERLGFRAGARATAMPSTGGATADGGGDWEGDIDSWQGLAGAQVCEHQLSRVQMEQDDFCPCRGGPLRVMFSTVQWQTPISTVT